MALLRESDAFDELSYFEAEPLMIGGNTFHGFTFFPFVNKRWDSQSVHFVLGPSQCRTDEPCLTDNRSEVTCELCLEFMRHG